MSVHVHFPSYSSVSVVDPHHLDADPYSTYHPDADSDSNFLTNADPDPDPIFKKKAQTLEKSATIGSYSIHFGFFVCKLMRIRIRFWTQLINLMRSGFLFDGDADPDAD
jgi:hypothetical protein